jgi:hypothetical protein
MEERTRQWAAGRIGGRSHMKEEKVDDSHDTIIVNNMAFYFSGFL